MVGGGGGGGRRRVLRINSLGSRTKNSRTQNQEQSVTRLKTNSLKFSQNCECRSPEIFELFKKLFFLHGAKGVVNSIGWIPANAVHRGCEQREQLKLFTLFTPMNMQWF